MQQVTFQAKPRIQSTKGANRRTRMEGRVPAVIYGGEKQPINISVNNKDLHKILHSRAGSNVLINMEIEGGATSLIETVIVKAIQREPLQPGYRHVDFYRISMDKELTTKVPVVIQGIAEGVKAGGILEFNLRVIEVQCLPINIPDQILVDVSSLQILDNIHVRNLTVLDGVKFVDEQDKVVLTIVPPAAEEVVAATTDAAEPEVIEKGKKEEEGEGEAKDKADAGSKDKAKDKS